MNTGDVPRDAIRQELDDWHFPKVLTTSATPKSVNPPSLNKVAK